MSTLLSQLLARRDQLQAEMQPLREQLNRVDEAISSADRALECRDRLLEQHDRTVAECIAAGRYAPPVDPALDDAELTLRRAKSTERGALLAREQIQRELAVIDGRLSDVQAQLDEETWAAVPSACSSLFAAAEAARFRHPPEQTRWR
jgi:hypothetical protein